MMLSFCSYRKSAYFVLLLATLMGTSVGAQDFGAMGISELMISVQSSLGRKQFDEAIPALREVIRRTDPLIDQQGQKTAQKARYQLGRCYYQTGSMEYAQEVLTVYLEKEPRYEERSALIIMAYCYFELKQWEEIEKITLRLLEIPDLKGEDRLTANLLLGQAYFQLKKWDECVKPLAFYSRHTRDKRIKDIVNIMIVRSLVEVKNWSELYGWLPAVYRTDAKYDITLNLTLMKAAKNRFEQEDYLNALLMYRMVLPREVLVEFTAGNIKKNEDKILAIEAKAKQDGTEVDPTTLKEPKEQIKILNESLKSIKELPPYEDEVTFRIGQIYAEVKRYWEGYVLFDKLYEQDRMSEIGEAAMLQSVLVLYDLKEHARAEERVIRYLEEQPNGQFVRTMLSMMMRDNLVRNEILKLISFRKYVDVLLPTSDPAELQLSADIHYMLAFGYLQNRDYKESGGQFGTIVDKYKKSPSWSDSIYYRGMTYMMQGNYNDGLTDFVRYQEECIGGMHEAAAVFREGVCLFGLEKIAKAEATFTRFITTYPDDALVSEAYSMRGDIEAAKDGNDNPETPDVDEFDPHTLDRAIADYRKGIETATNPLQASHATFQAAKVYKLEFKWQEIIDLMEYYMGLLDEDADVAEAVYWVGQAQIRLQRVPEAIDAYIEAIDYYGNDATQEGVDKIIKELVDVSGAHLPEAERDVLMTELEAKLNQIDPMAKVLRLRMQVILAKMKGEEALAALGEELLTTVDDLAITTPLSLSLMADASVRVKDTKRMGEIYAYFQEAFPEAEELWQGYRAKVYQCQAEENYEEMMQYIADAQSIFGAESFMGWAQMIKADRLFEEGKYQEAEDEYNFILGIGAWRGVMFAKAIVGMGNCQLKKKKFTEAHSFYQRLYLLFKGYDEGKWAAQGYLMAADVLLNQLGDTDKAVKTWQEMLDDEYVNTRPEADKARELLKQYGGAL